MEIDSSGTLARKGSNGNPTGAETQFSGSFTGSFTGDGSNLLGITTSFNIDALDD